MAERCADPAVHKSIAVDLARIGTYDELRRDVELTVVKTAKHYAANTLSRLQTVPGIGTSLSLGRLYAIHQIERCPRVQEFASSCRLVTCAKVSNGKRSGTSGANMGTAHLKWAVSDAAVFCLRDHPAGQKCLARLAQKPAQGKALTICAHTLARAVYDMLKRKTAVDLQRFLHGKGRGGAELAASLDHHGMLLTRHALQCIHAGVSERT